MKQKMTPKQKSAIYGHQEYNGKFTPTRPKGDNLSDKLTNLAS